MYFSIYLLNILLWAMSAAYLTKVIHLAYKQRTKRFIKARMQKAAMLGILVGFLSSISNGTHSISVCLTNVLFVALAITIYSVPKHRFKFKTKLMLKKQNKNFALKYPDIYLRLHRS